MIPEFNFIENWNKLIVNTGLERAVALSQYEGQCIELEGKFVRLGADKKSHIPNVHALITDILFFDTESLRYYSFSHFWINNITRPYIFDNQIFYYNPIWLEVPQNSNVRIRGVVTSYWDNKNGAYKNTLTNVIILSINGYRIAL